MTLAIALISLFAFWVAYFSTGYAIAKHRLPEIWARARERRTFDDTVRSAVKEYIIGYTLFWPVMLPIHTISDHMNEMVTNSDPKEKERKLREARQRIRELERETGIGHGG